MITFTKEQLIASAHARIEFAEMMLSGELEPLKVRAWSIDLELARIALASLEAEPVYQVFSFKRWRDVSEEVFGEEKKDGCQVRVLYTYPPAPVSVPDEMDMLTCHLDGVTGTYAEGWNACRAAMLQGADGNSPVIPDGWVACSERLPPEGYEPDGGAVCYLVWHKNEVDCGPQYSISNVLFLRKHWEKNFTHWMPLPAAPQREAK